MCSLQSVSRAILLPLSVLVLCAGGGANPVFAVSAPSGLFSGMTALRTLSLEGDSATLTSSPEDEVATIIDKDTGPNVVAASAENIAIRAVNPGYTMDIGKNAGELIELINLSGDEIVLDGLELVYESKTSTSSVSLYNFPSGARFVGESILLRYSGAPEAIDGAQDLTYDTSLAMAGSLALVRPSANSSAVPATNSATNTNAVSAVNDATDPATDSAEILSRVCWTGEEGCLPVFSTTVKSRLRTTILRDDETGEYSHVNNPELLYNSSSPGLYLPPGTPEGGESSASPNSDSSSPSSSSDPKSNSASSSPPVCVGLEFSEILTYYSDDASEQFIELYNNSQNSIDISKCRLRYKKKYYNLSNSTTPNSATPNFPTQTPSASSPAVSFTISPGTYYVYHPEIALTKNPTSELLFEIIDINGDIVDSLSLPHGQKKKTSYALTGHNLDGSEVWQITYNITPGKPNSFQEFQACPAGKVINVLTGNCVNAPTMKSSLNDCGVGKYRNPETGRCKSYSSKDDEQTPCQEGYERNPETNRCRKIKSNSGADYPIVPITNTTDQTSFIALWAILAIAGLGLVYVIFQFRREIFYFFRSLITKIRR